MYGTAAALRSCGGVDREQRSTEVEPACNNEPDQVHLQMLLYVRLDQLRMLCQLGRVHSSTCWQNDAGSPLTGLSIDFDDQAKEPVLKVVP